MATQSRKPDTKTTITPKNKPVPIISPDETVEKKIVRVAPKVKPTLGGKVVAKLSSILTIFGRKPHNGKLPKPPA